MSDWLSQDVYQKSNPPVPPRTQGGLLFVYIKFCFHKKLFQKVLHFIDRLFIIRITDNVIYSFIYEIYHRQVVTNT